MLIQILLLMGLSQELDFGEIDCLEMFAGRMAVTLAERWLYRRVAVAIDKKHDRRHNILKDVGFMTALLLAVRIVEGGKGLRD